MVPIYAEFTFGSSTNYITFNNEGDYTIKAIAKAATKRDIREFDTPIPNEMGITDYQSLIGKTAYIIEGQVFSEVESSLYTALDKLRKVFNLKIAQDDSESDDGYLPLKWTENESRMLYMKPLAIDIPETRRNAFKPRFKAILKIKYPIITSQTSHSISATPGSYGTGDGLAIPSLGLGIPAAGLAMGQNAGTSGNGTITNNGNYPAWPTIVFTGPTTNPKISDGENYIQVNTSIIADETITITYDQDTLTILKNDGTNLIQYLDSGSTLFKVESGLTQYTFSGQSFGSPADCSISILDSWALS